MISVIHQVKGLEEIGAFDLCFGVPYCALIFPDSFLFQHIFVKAAKERVKDKEECKEKTGQVECKVN